MPPSGPLFLPVSDHGKEQLTTIGSDSTVASLLLALMPSVWGYSILGTLAVTAFAVLARMEGNVTEMRMEATRAKTTRAQTLPEYQPIPETNAS